MKSVRKERKAHVREDYSQASIPALSSAEPEGAAIYTHATPFALSILPLKVKGVSECW